MRETPKQPADDQPKTPKMAGAAVYEPDPAINPPDKTIRTTDAGPEHLSVFIYPDVLDSGLIIPDRATQTQRGSLETLRVLVLSAGCDVKFYKPGDEVLVGDGASVAVVQHKRNRTVVLHWTHAVGRVLEEFRTEPRAEAVLKHGVDPKAAGVSDDALVVVKERLARDAGITP